MSNGMINKLKSWVTGDPFEDDVYGVEEDYDYAPSPRVQMEPQPTAAEMRKAKPGLKVLGHPNASQQSQVVVIEPRAFEEALEIVEHLRARKSIILNLHLLDTSQSQRVVDFLSGATHALDGNQHRIGDGVFIFTPSNVMITSEAQKGLSMADAYWNAAR